MVVVGIALAVTAAVLSQPRRPILVAVSLAIAMVLPYLFFVGSSAPRFLLPAYAFGSLAVASGIAEVARRWRNVTVALAVFGSVAVAASAAQATRFHDQQYLERREALEVGTTVAQLAGDGPCIALAQYGVPQVVITSGCQGRRLVVDEASCQIASLPDAGETVVVSLIGQPPPDLQAAAAGDEMTTRNRWTVLRVDRDLVRCKPGSADDGQ
jgi:hypothetical protein